MKSFLHLLAHYSISKTKIVLIVCLLSAFLGLFSGYLWLDFDTNQDNLISKKQKYFQNYIQFLKDFGDWEYIYVVIDLDNENDPTADLAPEEKQKKAIQLSDRLTERLQSHPELFAEVSNRFDLSKIINQPLLLAKPKDFKEIEKQILGHPELLKSFMTVETLADWNLFLVNLFDNPALLDTNLDKSNTFHLRFDTFLKAPYSFSAMSKLKDMNLLQMISPNFISSDGHLFSDNGQLLFIRVLPVKNFESMEIVKAPLETLRRHIRELGIKYPELTIGITGRPVLQNDEATSTQSDSEIAGLIAFVCVALLFFIFFKGYRRSLFALASLVTGIAWTTGFITLVFGSINLITIVFAIILIGLGIDYGVHYLIRYQKERLLGNSIIKSLHTTTIHTGSAIWLGALTSAIAFASAIFTDFLGLIQLGLITGMGIVFSCLAQTLFFPAMLRQFDLDKSPKDYEFIAFGRLRYFVQKPKFVLGLFLVGTIFCAPFITNIKFDSNVLKLQDQNLESVKFEKIIQNKSQFSTWFLASATKSKEDLSRWRSRLNDVASVKSTFSILDIVPAHQSQRIEKIENIESILNKEVHKNKAISLVDSQSIFIKSLSKLASKALSGGDEEGFEQISELKREMSTLFENSPSHEKEFLAKLKSYQAELLTWLTPTPITESMLPKQLLSTLKSESGLYSITIFPKENIWDETVMAQFIFDVRKVIPNVTGAPITHFESSSRMKRGFLIVALITSLVVLLLTTREFKSFKIALFLFVNLILTFLWLGAFMTFKGISINLANFFALPILIGSGIDHGIHIVHRYKETGSVTDLFTSTVPATTLSCLTTIFGFASLSFVRHQGLASFGVIMAWGTFFVLISTILVLPNLIALYERKKR